MKDGILKQFTRALVVIFFLEWSGIAGYPVLAQEAAKKEMEREELIERLENLFDALEDLKDEIPRDTFDPEAIIEKVGKDPIKLFEWVRDNTYLVPYRGVLRGPIGVLMDRMGNSLDRALLLHELLTRAGHDARLGHTTLGVDQAKSLFIFARGAISNRYSAISKILYGVKEYENIMQQYTKSIDIMNIISSDKITLRELTKKIEIDHKKQRNIIHNRVVSQTQFLMTKLEQHPGIHREHHQRSEVEALRDYWWVRCRQESIEVDFHLNPTQINEEYETQQYMEAKDINKDYYHRVTVRVIVEQWKKGIGETETIVFEHTLTPAHLHGVKVVLEHYPLNIPSSENIFGKKIDRKKLVASITKENEWLPVMTIGKDRFWMSSFRANGDINTTPNLQSSNKSAGVSGLGRAFYGVFGQGLHEKKLSKKEDANKMLSAEWLEYIIYTPNEGNKVFRRPVFDLIGESKRLMKQDKDLDLSMSAIRKRSFAILAIKEIAVQGSIIPQQYSEYRWLSNLTENRAIIIKVLKQWGRMSLHDLAKVATGAKPVQGYAGRLAFSRFTIEPEECPIYIARPNVLTSFERIVEAKDNTFHLAHGLDIVTNPVRTWCVGKKDYEASVRQGVMDTNVEAILLPKELTYDRNVADVLVKDMEIGNDWRIVREVNSDVLREIGLTNEAIRIINQEIAKGYIVVVPKYFLEKDGGTFVGWWRINLETGETLGIGPQGGGQSTSEFAIMLVSRIATTISMVDCAVTAKTDAGVWWCFAAGILLLKGPLFMTVQQAVNNWAWGYIIFGITSSVKQMND